MTSTVFVDKQTVIQADWLNDVNAKTYADSAATEVLINDSGSWTPVKGAGITLVGTISSSGSYQRVGRLVTVNGQFTGTTSVATTAGGVFCTGLPYAPAVDGGAGTVVNVTPNASGALFAVSSGSVYVAATMAASTKLLFSISYIAG